MNETIFTTFFKWLSNHKPDVTLVVVMLGSAIWLTTAVMDYTNRVDNLEIRLERCETQITDIATVQLPTIRAEVKEVRSEVKQMKEEMDKRFTEIKDYLIKIDTYLATTNKNYPKK